MALSRKHRSRCRKNKNKSKSRSRKSKSRSRKSKSRSRKSKSRSRKSKSRSRKSKPKGRFSQCSGVNKVSCLAKNKEGKCRWNYSENKCQGIGKIEWQGRQAQFIERGTVTPVYKVAPTLAKQSVKQIRDELEKRFSSPTTSQVVQAVKESGVAPTKEVVKFVMDDTIPNAPPMFFF